MIVRNVCVICLISFVDLISCNTDLSDQGQLVFAHVVSEPCTMYTLSVHTLSREIQLSTQFKLQTKCECFDSI